MVERTDPHLPTAEEADEVAVARVASAASATIVAVADISGRIAGLVNRRYFIYIYTIKSHFFYKIYVLEILKNFVPMPIICVRRTLFYKTHP